MDPQRDVVVIGASAGGIEALRELLAGIPPAFPGAVLVVLHIPHGGGNALASILDRAGPLRAHTAVDGEPLVGGRVYVCRADHHLLVGDGQVLVRRGPTENGHRPAVDALFRSAAGYYGKRVVAVVLSGTLHDGTAGLAAVRAEGGCAVVQDPADAMYGSMPSSALDQVGADFVVPAREIGPLLDQLVGPREPTEGGTTTSAETGVDVGADDAPAAGQPPGLLLREVAIMETASIANGGAQLGAPSPFGCPDCGGVLWEVPGDVLRFRCRVGHAWVADSLAVEQGVAVERALWVAVRALEERLSLSRRLRDRARSAGHRFSARRAERDLDEYERSVAVLRALIDGRGSGGRLGDDEDDNDEDDGG